MHKSPLPITSRHYLVLSVIAFSAGIFCTASVSSTLTFYLFLFASVLFCISGVFFAFRFFRTKTISHNKYLLLPCILLLFFVLGILRIVIAENSSFDRLREYNGKSVWLSGTVTSPCTETSTGYSYRFNFEVSKIKEEYISPQTVVMYIPEYCGKNLKEGDLIRCWTTLNTPTREDYFDTTDYYTQLRGKNIFYIGSTKSASYTQLDKPFHIVTATKDIGRFIKNKITYAVNCLIPENTDYAAIMKGILVGSKEDFSDKLYESFSNAGLSHLVAVSGMHLSILFSVFLLLLGKLRINKRLTIILSIPVIVAFAAVAGFTPSVCRSVLMLLTSISAMLLRKNYTSVNSLFLSLGIILIVVPYALFSVSLILSFCATFAILLYYKYIYAVMETPLRIPESHTSMLNRSAIFLKNFFCSSLSVSLSAFIGTMFFSVIFFGKVSWIQILTNLWVIPVVTLAFCLGFCSCILFYIAPNLTFAAFFYPLRFCLGVISSTADIFGNQAFVFTFNPDSVGFVHFVLYAGISIIIFLGLRLLYDTKRR